MLILFIQVVIDEIGWLDFFAPLKVKFQYDGRRSRQHAIQAEKEIILYTVLTVCYDVFSGFAHYTNSSQQPLDSDVLSFLFQRQCKKSPIAGNQLILNQNKISNFQNIVVFSGLKQIGYLKQKSDQSWLPFYVIISLYNPNLYFLYNVQSNIII